MFTWVEGEEEGQGEWVRYRDTTSTPGWVIERFRPRTEGLYALIERVTVLADPPEERNVYWRSMTRDHTESIFGRSAEARIADPGNASKIFSWLLEETRDAYGHLTRYTYKKELLEGANESLPSESHRRDGRAQCTNTYLKSVRYGVTAMNEESNATPSGKLLLVFDYGEHDASNPLPGDTGEWTCRADPFSMYRAGFEIRTYRLCKRVLMFHDMPELGGAGSPAAPTLVRSLDLAYDGSASMAKLTSATLKGYIRTSSTTYSSKSMPPVVLTYQEPTFTKRIHSFDRTDVEPEFPRQLLGKEATFVDLDGEGIAGVLTRRTGALHYQRNLGEGRLGPPRKLPIRPLMASARDAQLADVAGAGTMAVVSWSADGAGFHERVDDGWGPFIPFASQPKVDWNDPNLRFVDLNGDGFADILITRGDHFVWYPSLGKQGFGPAERVSVPRDIKLGPRIVFQDQRASVFLADMTGDGLADLVQVRFSSVSYWPNLGFGKFGAEVRMDDVPIIDHPDRFNGRQVRLADLDGSGTADLLYFHGNKGMTVYLNEAGNGFAEGQTNESIVEAIYTLQLADYYGKGMTTILWSPQFQFGEQPTLLRVNEPVGSEKPHLLKTLDNSMGKTVTFTYAPSTKFYLADRLKGDHWATKLPMPVWVVEKIETYDAISKTRYASTFTFHHGFYDTKEREFRGFGRVDQRDTDTFDENVGAGTFTETPPTATIDEGTVNEHEEIAQPPVLTKTWFHTGAWTTRDRSSLEKAYAREWWAGDEGAPDPPRCKLPEDVSPEEAREAVRALRGTALRKEVYSLDGNEDLQGKPHVVVQQVVDVRKIQPRRPRAKTDRPDFFGVFDVVPLESRTLTYDRIVDDPRMSQELALVVDEFGSVTRAASVAYKRRDAEFPEQDKLR